MQREQSTVLQDQKRRDLWQALTDFIHQEGAFVVSVPHRFPLRIEMRRDSSLAAKLAAYEPKTVGWTTRVVPDRIEQVEVIEIDAAVVGGAK